MGRSSDVGADPAVSLPGFHRIAVSNFRSDEISASRRYIVARRSRKHTDHSLFSSLVAHTASKSFSYEIWTADDPHQPAHPAADHERWIHVRVFYAADGAYSSFDS